MTGQRSTREAVDKLLNPGSIALVGASADQRKFSGQPVRNLLDAGYPGTIHPVADAAEPVEPTGAGTAGGARSEHDSTRRLAAAGIPFSAQELVTTPADAERAAARIGYPVVLKATGAGIAHKSEQHLVEVGVPGAAAVRERFADLDRRARALAPDGYQGVLVSELVADGVDVVAGVTTDPDLGALVLVGAGGVLTELIGDVAMAPAPLDEESARRLLGRTRVSRLLDGYRGGLRHDRDALVRVLVDLSEAAVAIDGLEAIDLNPVRVLPAGAVALDALITTTSRAVGIRRSIRQSIRQNALQYTWQNTEARDERGTTRGDPRRRRARGHDRCLGRTR